MFLSKLFRGMVDKYTSLMINNTSCLMFCDFHCNYSLRMANNLLTKAQLLIAFPIEQITQKKIQLLVWCNGIIMTHCYPSSNARIYTYLNLSALRAKYKKYGWSLFVHRCHNDFLDKRSRTNCVGSYHSAGIFQGKSFFIPTCRNIYI